MGPSLVNSNAFIGKSYEEYKLYQLEIRFLIIVSIRLK